MNKKAIVPFLLFTHICGLWSASFTMEFIDIEDEMCFAIQCSQFEKLCPERRIFLFKDDAILKPFIEKIYSMPKCTDCPQPDVRIKIKGDSLKTPICIGYNSISYDTCLVDRFDFFDILSH